MLTKLINHYCRFLTFLCVISLAVMVVLVFGNVVMRYGFNSGLTLSEELSRWLFVWMTFIGAIVALEERTHLGTDMLVAKLSMTGKKICLGLTHLLMLFVCWLLVQGLPGSGPHQSGIQQPGDGSAHGDLLCQRCRVCGLLRPDSGQPFLAAGLRSAFGRRTDWHPGVGRRASGYS